MRMFTDCLNMVYHRPSIQVLYVSTIRVPIIGVIGRVSFFFFTLLESSDNETHAIVLNIKRKRTDRGSEADRRVTIKWT